MTATTDNRELRAKARDAHSRIIHALADIVYVPTPDDLLGRDMISREPVMRQVMRIREAADELAAILSARQEVGAVESVWMFRCAGSRDEWMPFVNEKHRLNTMRSPEWEVREFTSPAHTSEARDAGLLDALRKIYEWEPYDAMSYGARRMAAQALNDYDAAMRQEGGSDE